VNLNKFIDYIDNSRKRCNDILRMMEHAERVYPEMAPLVDRERALTVELETLYDDMLESDDLEIWLKMPERLDRISDKGTAIFDEARVIWTQKTTDSEVYNDSKYI
jgi:hypothetical protein